MRLQKLKEKKIEKLALKALTFYYYRYAYNGKIFSEKQLRTIENKRADGLIVWKQNPYKINVAALEAKSHNTLHNLLQKPNEEIIQRDTFTLSNYVLIFITMLGTAFGFFYETTFNFLWVIACYLLLTILMPQVNALLRRLPLLRYKKTDVTQQLKQYYGNEKWIAIGYDSYSKPQQFDDLKKMCQKNGFGLLMVLEDETVERMLKPVYQPCKEYENFTYYYTKREAILESIEGGSKMTNKIFNFTPAYQSHLVRQYRFTVFASMVFVMSCIYIFNFYEKPIHVVQNAPNEEIRFKPENNEPIYSPPEIPESYETPTIIRDREKLCEGKIKGTKYVLIEKFCVHEEEAKKRVANIRALKVKGLKADYFWLPCYQTDFPNLEVFGVFLYRPQETEEKAQNYYRKFEYFAKQQGLEYENIQVIKVEPM